MIEPVVSSPDPVTLVGAGKASLQDLQNSLSVAPTCVAADSGAALALEGGAEIAALIGDFDSVSAETLARIPRDRQHPIPEQDSTDFEKALSRISAPLVLGVGFLGGRVDHELAALHVLATWPHRPCLLIGEEEVICLAPPRIELPTRDGDTVSLFPLGQLRGRSDGLFWPIDEINFDPLGRIGTSNRALGPIRLEFSGPCVVLILPRRLMPELAEAFLAADAPRWLAPEG